MGTSETFTKDCRSDSGTPIQGQQNESSLPRGIVRDAQNVIRWTQKERDYSLYFFMDSGRIGYKVVHNPKEDTVGSAFKDLLKSGAELAADNIAMDSETYAGQDLPWDESGGVGSTYLTFSYIKKVKLNPKKCEIKLKESISRMTLEMTEEQYPFIAEYIIQHVQGAKVK